jgi:hypothetical protein
VIAFGTRIALVKLFVESSKSIYSTLAGSASMANGAMACPGYAVANLHRQYAFTHVGIGKQDTKFALVP